MIVNGYIYNFENKARISNKYKLNEKRKIKSLQKSISSLEIHDMSLFAIHVYRLGFQKHPNFKNKYKIVSIHLASECTKYTLCLI